MVEAFKSGFEPPGDVDFEDFTQPIKRTVSDSSLSNSKDGKPESRFSSKSKGKLWPFIKKNKVPDIFFPDFGLVVSVALSFATCVLLCNPSSEDFFLLSFLFLFH